MSETTRCCGTCKHWQPVDARRMMQDPDARYVVCTWTPPQPFWMPAPFLSRGVFVSPDAITRGDEGRSCPVWEEKDAPADRP
jgi:hypothetical protein